MALHSKVEFSALCGFEVNALAVYIKRKKVIVREDGMIDDKQRDNTEFLKRRAATIASKSAKAEPVPDKKKKPRPEPEGDDDEPEFTVNRRAAPKEKKDIQDHDRYDLELVQKKMAIEKAAEEIEILKVKKDKLQGSLIPTDLVRALIVTHSESLKLSYSEACENLIVIFGGKKQLSTQEIADMRKELARVINTAMDRAVEASKKTLKTIVREYSEQKGRGEKETGV
jgi:hypothetical protein